MSAKLYMLMGLPGSGKTTAAKCIASITGAVRLSSDEERLKLWSEPTFTEEEHAQLYAFLNEKTRELLAEGNGVVYDANLNRKKHRDEKYNLAHEFGVETILFWVKTPKELAKSRRIQEVEHHKFVPQAETPDAMFDRIAEILEPPKSDEPYIELDGTKITKTYVSEKLSLR